MGAAQDYRQPKWIEEAFSYIQSQPSVKAAIYWDNVNLLTSTQDWSLPESQQRGHDNRLSQPSLLKLREVFGDPYFVLVK
jgi:hypothetical protein